MSLKAIPIYNLLKYATQSPDKNGRIPISIQNLDPEQVLSNTIIALEEYDRAKNSNHGLMAQIFVGIVGEYAFKQALKTYNLEAIHNEIEREHWKEGKATTDLKLIPCGVGLEICTTPPTNLYEYGIVSAKKLKRPDWKYAVFLKLTNLKYEIHAPINGEHKWYRIDASQYNPWNNNMFSEIGENEKSSPPSSSTKIIGEAIIYGYATRDEIEKGLLNKDEDSEDWRLVAAPNKPCPKEDGIVKKLDAIVESGKTADKLMPLLSKENLN